MSRFFRHSILPMICIGCIAFSHISIADTFGFNKPVEPPTATTNTMSADEFTRRAQQEAQANDAKVQQQINSQLSQMQQAARDAAPPPPMLSSAPDASSSSDAPSNNTALGQPQTVTPIEPPSVASPAQPNNSQIYTGFQGNTNSNESQNSKSDSGWKIQY